MKQKLLAAALLLTVLLSGCSPVSSEPAPRTFSSGDFSITLTERFSAVPQEEAGLCYQSEDHTVLVAETEFSALTDAVSGDPAEMSPLEFALLAAEVTDFGEATPKEENGLVLLEYTRDGVYFLVAFYSGPESFFTVTFSAGQEDRVSSRVLFLRWGASVRFAPPAA